ncbi:MAG: MMPL family transporter [Flavobacteriaceae bacterium]|nr:MMPL family transporter [Flavobacteriaceae bacterium]
MTFWTGVSRFILRKRYVVLTAILLITIFLITQLKYIQMSYSEANLLPEHHEINLQYNHFLDVFGEEGNLIVVGTNDKDFFTPKKLEGWNRFFEKLKTFDEVDFTLSFKDIQTLKKNTETQHFDLTPLLEKMPKTKEDAIALQRRLTDSLPFYEHILYNKEKGAFRSLLYLKKDIINTPIRMHFVLDKLNPLIEQIEKEYDINLCVSGLPYARTMNSQNIEREISLFLGLALGITALIFFFFFRSFIATLVTLFVVIIGVIWAFGFIGLFRYEITILTALIPPLIIIIGVPNAIFLINKYQQEIKKHGNQAKSLVRVIAKIGNATLLTNFTTALGFLTFIFTDSSLMREFGIIASIDILGIFILALLLIPILYSFLPIPKERHLKHLEKGWISAIVRRMKKTVKYHRKVVYAVAITLFIMSVIGASMMKVSGSLIEDMPKGKNFVKELYFFEENFGGVMPLEILVDAQKPKGVLKLSTIKRIEKLNEKIETIPELSSPISISKFVKYTKQAFYNGNTSFYKLPNQQEKNWILSYLQKSKNSMGLLSNFVDETGQYARITTFMKDINVAKMEHIESELQQKIDKLFPNHKVTVTFTGKALAFLKGTPFLIDNLMTSLSLAILVVALIMILLFRSVKMVVVSLIPNLLPLIVTAGLMGYFGIPLKPSTILVFSVAFGISVDDTIHFLAKYRQELQSKSHSVKKCVYRSLRETGVSMFYTSIVLFFGFLVFTVSEFGGTIALGGLISVTLLVAMVANLVLLPSLLLTFFGEKND